MDQVTFNYRAYGLNIKSGLKLGKFVSEKSGTNDVSIHFGKLNNPSDFIMRGNHFKVTLDGIYLFWDNIGLLKVLNGNEIIIDPVRNVDKDFLEFLIMGSAFGALLQQRGSLVLHGSAVRFEDGVIAFLGNVGYGKSTTAMALYLDGFPYFTDDILPVNFDLAGLPIVSPGYPYSKISEEVSSSLGENKVKSTSIHKITSKHLISVNENFSTDSLPLKQIYILSNGSQNEIKTLNPNHALKELVKNSYNLLLFKNEDQISNLKICAKLTKLIPVRILNINKSIEGINNITGLVKEDLINHQD